MFDNFKKNKTLYCLSLLTEGHLRKSHCLTCTTIKTSIRKEHTTMVIHVKIV